MSRRPVCVGVAVVVLLLATRAAADPKPTVYHVGATFKVTLASGSVHDMPPAYIVPEPSWAAIDAEVKRLQDAETKLTAERDSLTTSVQKAGPGWGTAALVVAALVAGTVAGAIRY